MLPNDQEVASELNIFFKDTVSHLNINENQVTDVKTLNRANKQITIRITRSLYILKFISFQ